MSVFSSYNLFYNNILWYNIPVVYLWCLLNSILQTQMIYKIKMRWLFKFYNNICPSLKVNIFFF